MKTLLQYLEEFTALGRATAFSPHTIRMRQHNIGHTLRWLDERLGVRAPAQLTAAHLEAWAKFAAGRESARGMPLRPTSIRKQFDSDRVFLHWLEKTGAVPEGLHDAVPKYKVPLLLPTSVLNHRQMERVLNGTETDTSEGLQLRAMEELLYSSGIRVAELLALDVGEVDLPGRLARVMGKGKKERIVPFGLTAQRYLESFLRGIRPLLVSGLQETAMFLDHAGKRMPYHTFRRQLEEHLKQFGFSMKVTAYTFRRTCATELVRSGANLYHVKDLLGHESLDTLKHYAKLTIVDLKKTHARCHPREHDRK
jgi:integrase/recombinase XerC